MNDLCINCGKADLRPDTVRLSGVVRSEPYEVEMAGLKCPNCSYMTVDAKGMTEFSRLLSDRYRAKYGLLTSDQILSRRNTFKESQEQFAKRCDIGIATLKRIEKGKIQDADTNKRILDNTRTPVENTCQYVGSTPTGDTTIGFYGWSILRQPGSKPSINTANVIMVNIGHGPLINTDACIMNVTQESAGEGWNTAQQYILPFANTPATTTPLDFIPLIVRGSHARY